MKRVLEVAAEKFRWTQRKAPSGRGYGVACGIDAGTYVAHMAEVEVDKKRGLVQVKRVVCAQDMGLAVNPEGARLQVEGCITMGLGYALSEEIRFKGGEILDHNFDTYEIPRFSWTPEIDVVLVDGKDSPAQGGGGAGNHLHGRGRRQRHLRRHGRETVSASHDPGENPGGQHRQVRARSNASERAFLSLTAR